MSEGVAAVLIAVVVGLILALPLAPHLKRHPVPFYILALVLTGAYAYCQLAGIKTSDVRFLTIIEQKGYLAAVLLAIVMFTGTLDETSTLRRRLQPVRGELSILSFIFILGHLVTYLPLYLPRLPVLFGQRTGVAISLVIAMLLTVIFLVLTATSFRAIRTHMKPRSWKRLQRLSYLMVGLLFLHVVLALGRSALIGGWGSTAAISLVFYVAIIAIYAVARICKAWRDQRGRSTRRAQMEQRAGIGGTSIAGE